ncbi:MAG: ABC transporter ATP-binding protein [Gemmatimonadetes bacterium]|nr:ABC transporter ATP-binding protein [Gemmatimonadota bacterium]
MVRLEHVGLRFGDRGETAVQAVADVSLEVPRGALTLVMGPSGSGKTTLLSLIGGLLAPTAGEVYVDGVALGQLSQPALTAFRLARIGFVFQTFRLLAALSVSENIELPLNLRGVRRPASRVRARELASQLGVSHRLDFRPRALSGGEQQRVALARALANDPVLLLADEPTGSLDSQAGQQIIELLHAAAREGKAVLVLSHDARLGEYADTIVRMQDGRIMGT